MPVMVGITDTAGEEAGAAEEGEQYALPPIPAGRYWTTWDWDRLAGGFNA